NNPGTERRPALGNSVFLFHKDGLVGQQWNGWPQHFAQGRGQYDLDIVPLLPAVRRNQVAYVWLGTPIIPGADFSFIDGSMLWSPASAGSVRILYTDDPAGPNGKLATAGSNSLGIPKHPWFAFRWTIHSISSTEIRHGSRSIGVCWKRLRTKAILCWS